ncbi:MAG: tetratricopeptide repeat protein [Chitinispirillales bacterium]|jgi:tetratricopeptide (TPR) repeat protein|nr:tetratricopeptide repeat protein [Chitinispirillales bacterium]
MESSPLELYETAYRLHYAENRIPEALKYYEALIKEFPESNECGYAVVQIQKIKSNDVAASVAGKSKAHPLATLSFLLCLLMMGGLGGAWLILQDRLSTAQRQTSLSAKALANVINGNDDDALMLLNEMKLLSSADITPYELSALIYRRAGKTDKARSEYDVFFSLNPAEREKYGTIEELVPNPMEKKPKR